MIMYISLGWYFPHLYIFSLGIMIIFAMVVSCIPSRIFQICIFTLILTARAIVVVGNVIAAANLGELFILESLRGVSEMVQFGGASYIPVLLTTLVSSIIITFLVVSIIMVIRFKGKKHRAGYNWRGLVASFVVMLLMATSVTGTFLVLTPINNDEEQFFTNNLDNNRFILSTFLNRHAFIQRFGPSLFYITNLLEILNVRPTFGMTVPRSEGHWNEPVTPILELDENFNLIMFMMETVEFDAINPLVTPNIWRLMSKSTWVDGYHAFERTVMTEYVSLTGGHTMGQEMWFTYTNNHVPQNLPNIFRRMGHQQLGSFHNFRETQFLRHEKLPAMGFDFYRTTNFYIPDSITGHTNRNSDFLMIDAAIYDIAPIDRTFMNYVLTVSPHHSINIHLQNRYENNEPVFANLPYPHQRRAFAVNYTADHFHYTQHFVYDIARISEMEYYLAQFFPKLAVGTDFERIAAFQYLVKVHNLDRGVGRLLDHLENTPDFRHKCGTVMLIDTTALVLYSDHFGHSWYNHRDNSGGGKLTNTSVRRPLGEQLAFIVYNPRETELRTNALPQGWRWDDVSEFFKNKPFNPTIYSHDPGTRVTPPLVGRRIERFMANIDIYPTVAHLFGIRTHSNITLGVSIFEEDNFSIGVGFITGGLFFGKCPESGLLWATRDMASFGAWHHGPTTPPTSSHTITLARNAINQAMQTMYMLRIFHEANSFPYYAYYVFGPRTYS